MAFGISPATPTIAAGDNPPAASDGFPRYIQFQTDGSNLGAPDVDTVNFVGNLTATRGTGENANRVTVAAAAGGGGSETQALVVQLEGAVSGLFDDAAFSNWNGTVLTTSDDASWNEVSSQVTVTVAGVYSVRMSGRVTGSPNWPAGNGDWTIYGCQINNSGVNDALPDTRSAHARRATGTMFDNSVGYVQFSDEFVIEILEEDLPNDITPALYANSYLGTDDADFSAVVIVKRLA